MNDLLLTQKVLSLIWGRVGFLFVTIQFVQHDVKEFVNLSLFR